MVASARFGLAVALVAALFVTGSAFPAAAAQPDELEAVIVVLAGTPDEPEASAREIAGTHGAHLGFVYRHALKGFSARVPGARLDALAKDPRVAMVEPDQPVHIFQQSLPTGIDRIEAERNATADIDGVDERVAVDLAIIDTGIDLDHPDLNVRFATDCTGSIFFPNCTGSSTNLDDCHGHGSHVAGSASALDNDFGPVGVAPGAVLWSVKVLDCNGSGYLSWVIAGIDAVTEHADRIEVANMSLGGEFTSDSLDLALSNSVEAGVVYVVAAGNSAKDASGFSPANHPDVITVSALADFDGQGGGAGAPTCRDDQDDTLADFSNFGPTIELASPGVCIYSTWKDGGYHTISGTSMASPHGAGAAGLYIARTFPATRDYNGDGQVDRNDVYLVRQALIEAALPAADACGYTDDSGDGLAEPLLFVNGVAFGGDRICQVAGGDQPPTVNITNPADGSTVSGTIAVTAEATDDHDVAQVEFFVDGASIGVDTSPSDGSSAIWDTTSAPDGTHQVTATATDGPGQTGSDSVSVDVDNVDSPPTLSLTSPSDGALVKGALTVTADATDDQGVSRVEFFVDGTSIGVDTSGSDGWSASWDTTSGSEGAHDVSATATDTAAQTANASVSVTVDNTAPFVEITSPSGGGTVNGTITVSATASDATPATPGTGVSRVEFFVDGASIGVDTNGSDGWSTSWDSTKVSNGDHDLTARAADGAGNEGISSVVTVTVESTTHHVGDLDGESYKLTRGRWAASVSVLVHDAQDTALAEATVTGIFTLPDGSTIARSCTTLSGSRVCFVESGPLPRNVSRVTFTVTDVSHGSSSYESGANHDPDGDSDGTTITIAKP